MANIVGCDNLFIVEQVIGNALEVSVDMGLAYCNIRNQFGCAENQLPPYKILTVIIMHASVNRVPMRANTHLDQQFIKRSNSETPEAGDHSASPITFFRIFSAFSMSTRPFAISPTS